MNFFLLISKILSVCGFIFLKFIKIKNWHFKHIFNFLEVAFFTDIYNSALSFKLTNKFAELLIGRLVIVLSPFIELCTLLWPI